MIADFDRISRLQSVDQRIAELQQEVAALPKHIAQIERTLDSHIRRLEADRAALSANQKERRRLEDEVKVQEQKISKLKDQSLLAKTNEQYRAFQHEIEYCEKEIRKSEDRILDLMGESETLDVNVKRAEAALTAEKRQVESEKADTRERTAADQKELDQLSGERKELVGGLDRAAYAEYERIRKKWHGSALAEATEGRCSACHIALRPQFFQELKKRDQLMFCESCGRILTYNPPVSFEHDIAAPVPGGDPRA